MTKPKKKKAEKCTPRQDRFCKEYVIDLNGARAYRKVYKCSDKAAESGASRTLRKAKVKARIRELRKGLEKKAGITAKKVIDELAKVAFVNIKSILGSDNVIQDISQAPDDVAAAVESVQTTSQVTRNKDGSREYETLNVKVKLHSKLTALNDLGKHLGIFEKDKEQGKPKAPQIIVFGTVVQVNDDTH